jgi:hypothetical protein
MYLLCHLGVTGHLISLVRKCFNDLYDISLATGLKLLDCHNIHINFRINELPCGSLINIYIIYICIYTYICK